MNRLILCVGLGFVFADLAAAADPIKKRESKSPNTPAVHRYEPRVNSPTTITPSNPTSIESGAVELKPVPATGRKHWEAILSQPAGLDFGQRESVSVKELLDQLRERHQFSLRMDIPTFTSLFFDESESSTTSTESPMARLIAPATRIGAPIQFVSSETDSPSKSVREDDRDEDHTPDSEAKDAADSKEEKGEDNENSADAIMRRHRKDQEQHERAMDGDRSEADEEGESAVQEIETLLSAQVPIRTIDLKRATVATVLRQALDVLPIPSGTDLLEMSFPMTVTDACKPDYLVEEDGFLITTQMAALAHKEIRVYSIRQFKDLDAEQLSKVIRQTVRPWSWRSQVNDIGEQLRGSIQVPGKTMKSIVQTGVQLAAAEMGGVAVTMSDDEPQSLKEKSEKSDDEDMSAIGNAAVNGLITLVHASLSGLQMFHYGEFPTGTIQTLPGKLIVRQSQAAHREIGELLKQLAEE